VNGKPQSYLIPSTIDLAELERRFIEALDLELEGHGERRRSWLDSFDWRLWSANSEILLEKGGDQTALQWRSLTNGESYGQLVGNDVPRYVWDLPVGPFRERLAPIVEMRALLPLVTVRSRYRALVQRNADNKLTLLVDIEENRVVPARGGRSRPLDARVTVTPVKGYEGARQTLTRLLETELGLVPAEALLAKALAAIGREPGDYSSKLNVRLDREMRSDEAAKRILAELLETMVRNEQGIIDDVDSEFLHDFRVAVRRTRTALVQIKDVFPKSVLDRFQPQFAWLGQLTTPTRDLDVYLLQFDDYRSALPPAVRGDLEPLHAFLHRHRTQEQATLVKGLRSMRYQRFVEAWRRFLTSPGPQHSPLRNATRAIDNVAGHRIWRMYKRVVREGEEITTSSPDEALHELRKSCKKLRYLMEFFQSLYPVDQIKRSIKALKILQDNLGEFQDLSVQIQTLRRFAEQMVREGEVPSETLIAMGILVEQLAERQHCAREQFANRFEQFVTAENREHFRGMFKPTPAEERLAG
jgi:CHAD domain-containing protein